MQKRSACLKAPLVALLYFLLCGSAWAQDSALDLFHKMQRALGGADKIAAIKDLEESVQADVWDNGHVAPLGRVRKLTRWVRPNILRLDQVGPGNTYVLYFDGSSGWEIPPERGSLYRTSGNVTELADGELEFAKGYLSGFDLTLWLADQNPAYVISSPAPNVVRISWNNNANATDITLDQDSGLPLKQAGVSLADPSKPVTAEMLYSGWSEIEGVKFPTKKSNFHNGVKLAESISLEIRVNQGLIPAALTTKPEDLQPDMNPRVKE